MTEETKAEGTAAIAATGQAQPQGEPPKTGPSVENQLKRLQRERDELKQKLEAEQLAKKTTEEKAIDEAYKRGQAETQATYEARLKTERIDATVRRTLIENGVPENQVHVIMGENPDGFDDPELAKKAAADYAVSWKEANRPTLKGQPGSPTPRPPADLNRPWSNRKLTEYARAHGARLPDDIRAQATEDQKNKVYVYD